MPAHSVSGPPLLYQLAESPLGWLLLGADNEGICALLLGDAPQVLEADLQQRFPERPLQRDEAALAAPMQAILRRLSDPRAPLNVALAPRGTPYQQRVWQALGEIPLGQTLSYGELAARCGSHPRAVARACASNPVAVLIPCHRVVDSRGQLTGYRWGLARKAQLLATERGAQAAGA